MSDKKSIKKVGRYTIIEKIASGGMAVVYKARDPKLKRQVAIKVMNKDLAIDEAFRARFEKEMEILAKLKDPNIVSVYDGDWQGEHPYIVMELIDGKTLQEVFESKDYNTSQKLDILEKIAEGLDYAHEEGVVHGDLKPNNIMIDKKDVPKILDFGIAMLSEGRVCDGKIFIGTPRYSCPEQATTGAITGKQGDLFTLGLMTQEWLSGSYPFSGTRPEELIQSIRADQPEITVPKGFSESGWHRLFEAALSKNPEDRPVSARQFVADLKKCLAPKPGRPLYKHSQRHLFGHRRNRGKLVLQVVNGVEEGRTYHLKEREMLTLGKRAGWRIDCKFVSPQHAIIRRNGERVELMDLDSDHGTFVEGSRLPNQDWTDINRFFVLGTTILALGPVDDMLPDRGPAYLDTYDLADTPLEILPEIYRYRRGYIDILTLWNHLLSVPELGPMVTELSIDATQVKRRIQDNKIFDATESWLNAHLARDRGAYHNDSGRVLLTPLVARLMDDYRDSKNLEKMMNDILYNPYLTLVQPLLEPATD